MKNILLYLFPFFLLLAFNQALYSQKLKESFKAVASDQTPKDNFGLSVDITDKYAIAGAPYQDRDTASGNILFNAGAAYIYEKDSAGNWFQKQKLVASDRDTSDYFGYAVSISDKYAVVGAYAADEDAAGLNTKIDAGAAYVFEKDSNGIWQQIAKLIALDRDAGDYFGAAVVISGNYIVIGAYEEDDDTAGTSTLSNAGSAYIFKKDSSGNWVQNQKIVSADRDAEDYFAYSLAMDSTTLLIGAYQEDHDANGLNRRFSAGSAYIYNLDTSENWVQTQKIVASLRNNYYYFAQSLAIDNNHIIIGAPNDSWDTIIGLQRSEAWCIFCF